MTRKSIINGEEKREVIIYVVVVLWAIFAVLSSIFAVDYASMSVYFLSLTGFVSAYIWGESVRKSEETSVFKSGASSSREKMMYVTIILWTLLGFWGIYKQNDFVNLAAYFGALTPFVGAYILGRTYKPNLGDLKQSDNGNSGKSPVVDNTKKTVENIPTDTKPADEIG